MTIRQLFMDYMGAATGAFRGLKWSDNPFECGGHAREQTSSHWAVTPLWGEVAEFFVGEEIEGFDPSGHKFQPVAWLDDYPDGGPVTVRRLDIAGRIVRTESGHGGCPSDESNINLRYYRVNP